jgi:amino acid transporter
MIAISAVIGAGYYIETGVILRLGGPAAVVYSFAIVGALAFMVLHGLAHMLRVWPVAGALISFVRAFVDEEIAIVVGLFYW